MGSRLAWFFCGLQHSSAKTQVRCALPVLGSAAVLTAGQSQAGGEGEEEEEEGDMCSSRMEFF